MKSVNKIAILISLLIPATTFALDIGHARVHSELYQALNADVPLTNISGISIKELHVNPAPVSAYLLRGIALDPITNQMNLRVVNVDGNAVIEITSPVSVTEPILNFLVQLQWPQGEVIKKVTLLPQLPGQGDEIPMVMANNANDNFTREINTLKNKAQTVWQETINKILVLTKNNH